MASGVRVLGSGKSVRGSHAVAYKAYLNCAKSIFVEERCLSTMRCKICGGHDQELQAEKVCC